MENNRNGSFTGLFAETWNTFKKHYGTCFGLSLVVLAVVAVSTAITISMGLAFSSREALLTGAIASIAGDFISEVLIVTPVMSLLLYRLVSKIRGEGGLRSGWLPRILVIGFLAQLVILPSTICAGLGNSSQWEELKLLPEAISARMQVEMELQTTTAAQAAQERVQEVEQQFTALRKENNPVLSQIGTLLGLLGLVFIMTWAPWAVMVGFDSRERCEGISETIRRGRKIARGSTIGIILTGVVLSVIATVTLWLCLLPGLFFGSPLLFAWIPAVYVALRDGPEDEPPGETI